MRTIACLLLSLALVGCAATGEFAGQGFRVLPDDAIWRVQPGQTRQEVLEMFGPPYQTMAFPRLGQVAWDYRYVDTWGYQAILSVTFDAEGRVVSRLSQRIERDRGVR